MSRALCQRVLELCDEALRRLPDGEAAAAVGAVAARLGENSLRVAVAGRLNAGKSTLVNTLLGQRLAATDATECTRVVTWFRYHHQNRIVVHPRSGPVYYLRAPLGGGIPADLGRPVEEISSVAVEVSNRLLADRHQIVDTPGLDALSGLDKDTMTALRDVDALLFVMPHPGDRDREALEAFRRGVARTRISAANAVGVLSRIDQLGDGVGDPWEPARRIAGRYAAQFRGLLADVVPVVGLLAQTVLGDEFSERDTHALLRLGEADPMAVEDALYSAEDFLGWDAAPVDRVGRRRLLGLLGLYGVREASVMVGGGVRHTGRLLHELRLRSGIDNLLRVIGGHFVESADRLRADSAITLLDQATWRGGAGEEATLQWLRSQLAELRRDPDLRYAELTGLLADIGSGAVVLPEENIQEVFALFRGRTPAQRVAVVEDAPAREIAAVAAEKAAAWRRVEAGGPRRLSRHARTVWEIYQAMSFAAGGA